MKVAGIQEEDINPLRDAEMHIQSLQGDERDSCSASAGAGHVDHPDSARSEDDAEDIEDSDDRSIESETSDEDEPSLLHLKDFRAKVYAAGFQFFGGPGNLPNRENKNIPEFLDSCNDGLQDIISEAYLTRDNHGYGTKRDIYELLEDFIREDLYVSKRAVRRAFPEDFRILRSKFPMKYSIYELPEYDMPPEYQRKILKHFDDLIREQTHDLLANQMETDLEEKGIQNAADLIMSSDRVIKWLRSRRCRSILKAHHRNVNGDEQEKLLRLVVEIYNRAHNPSWTSVERIVEACKATIKFCKTFGFLQSRQVEQLPQTLTVLEDWIDWSDSNKSESRKWLCGILEPHIRHVKSRAIPHGPHGRASSMGMEATKSYFSSMTMEKREEDRQEQGKCVYDHIIGGSTTPFSFPDRYTPSADMYRASEKLQEDDMEDLSRRTKRGNLPLGEKTKQQDGQNSHGVKDAHSR